MSNPNPKTKYCVVHQIETDKPYVLLITSQLKKAVRCIVKDIMASEAYTFKKSRLKRRIEEDWSFHAGAGLEGFYDNYYIIPWEKKPSQSKM